MKGDKEVPVLDFTEGTTWFFAGLSTTALFVALLALVAAVSRWAH